MDDSQVEEQESHGQPDSTSDSARDWRSRSTSRALSAVTLLFLAFMQLVNYVPQYSHTSGRLAQPTYWAVAATISFSLGWLVSSLAVTAARNAKLRTARVLHVGWSITYVGAAAIALALNWSHENYIGDLCFICALAGGSGGLFRVSAFRGKLLPSRRA